MANYNVDISVAIKNTNKLTAFNKQLKDTSKKSKELNQGLKEITRTSKSNFANLNNLSNALAKAQRQFNKTVLGTKANVLAARDLATAERMVNKELKERTALMNKFRFQGGNSGFKSFSQKADKIQSPNVLTVSQQKSIDRHNRKDTDKHLKNIDNKVAKIATIQTQQQISRIPGGDTGVQFGVPGGKIGPALPRGFRLRQQFAPGGAFFNSRGTAGRISSGLQSGLIGGGFPLLFGQGGAGAIAGGLGGALGGALSPGFGFAGSIAATAITQQIQQTLEFRKSIRDLNKEMEQMGISSNISGTAVRNLGKSLGITKEEAVKALQEFKRFGNNAILFAEKFGGDFAKFDAIAQANTVQSALAAIRKINKDLTLDDELRFINSVRRLGVEETINQMIDEMLEKEKKLKTEGFGQGEGKNAGANRKRLGQLRQERDARQVLVDKNKAFIEGLTKVRDQFIQNRDAAEAANRSIAKGLEDVNAELRKLNDVQFQVVELSKTLGSAFSDSFKGIIKGTMSVGEAFRSMFMRIADHFLDMAAQMMAAQISRGFLGLFGNMFSLGNTTDVFEGFNRGAAGGLTIDNFANGGRPPVGRPSIVGEKGPELFVPDRTGTIIPNHAMGGMNIVVNVDASGSSVEGDEQQGRELGRLISVAVQSELVQQKRPGGLLA